MASAFDKLKAKLLEMFQLDQPDLDFGIYRVLHARADEITRFLEQDLLPQVREAFGEYRSADKAELEKQIDDASEQARRLGFDPEQSPQVQELRERYNTSSVDIAALESEVYDDLYRFFRRYYQEGDFLSKRVYKSGVYAIPYEGEEVKLHWANKDQYYIKTSEYLRDYAFRLRPDHEKNPMRVHFRLVDATEGEHGNVKPTNGDRVFVLAEPDFIAEEDGELIIRFEYRPATLTDWPEDLREGKTKPPLQKDLIEIAVARILAVADISIATWIEAFREPHTKADGETADYSRLEAHLRRYTARNTFDYFIHKDLGGFLRRELDFFIKNEVMHLDDIEDESTPRVEQYLSKIKVTRRIAHKIIDFLAQIEDFQRKLWLKKKFIVETSWCIRVGCIPESFYPEIAANEAQRVEWVHLFSIDTIEGDLATSEYSVPLTVDFLISCPNLVVDTRHFAQEFIVRLLDSVGDLDSEIDALLIHSENFHALASSMGRLRNQVDCVFTDPPYNTGQGDFPYKDSYQHASWISMMADRIRLAIGMQSDHGSLWLTLDEHEAGNFQHMIGAVFGDSYLKGRIAWEKVYSPRMDAVVFSSSFDHLFVVAKNQNWKPNRIKITPNLEQFPYIDSNGRPYRSDTLRKWGKGSLRTDRPNLWFPITSPDGVVVWPIKPDGTEGRWRWDRSTVAERYDELDWLDKGNGVQPYARQYADKSDDRPVETLWRYDDVGSTHEAQEELKAILPKLNITTPKPTRLVRKCVLAACSNNCTVLDMFAGSGTTGHATIQLNRGDGFRRRAILIEMGEYFDTVMLPRLKKVTFSPEWKEGKPNRAATKEETDRGPRILKVVRLESYEDTLNNLATLRTTAQQAMLDAAELQGVEGLREDYLLRYMLDVETQGSQSLLNVKAFTDPTAYKLNVKRPGSDESRMVNVDLLETFNWLIGLTVQHIAAPKTLAADFERDSEKRLQIKGRLKPDEDGPWWFRTVTGTTPEGLKTLVVWRRLPTVIEKGAEGAEYDNLVLDAWFTKQDFSTQDFEFDLIYVNGDNNLANLKQPNDTWKVRLIEEDFHRLMFDTDGLI